MGAWGTDSFENDSACDWGHDLDADLAVQALAACEVIARLKGRFGVRDAYTESVDAWVAEHRLVPSPKLVARALAVLDRVTVAPSELLELWQEGGEDEAWLKSVAGLRARVAA